MSPAQYVFASVILGKRGTYENVSSNDGLNATKEIAFLTFKIDSKTRFSRMVQDLFKSGTEIFYNSTRVAKVSLPKDETLSTEDVLKTISSVSCWENLGNPVQAMRHYIATTRSARNLGRKEHILSMLKLRN